MFLKDGIFLINKKKGMTSNQVIQSIKKRFKIPKIGHAGTLDPLATGLLIVLINKATKISDFFLLSNKIYDVKMKLFIKTDSGDITGKIINKEKSFKIKKELILKIFNYFNGLIYQQYPPIYSAIKYKGKKLYYYARKNQIVNIIPRTVVIYKIFLKKYNFFKNIINFSVICSKGTYIRSLVCDIAAKFNTFATVIKLVRIKSGNFFIKNSQKNNFFLNKNHLISIYDSLYYNNFKVFLFKNENHIKNKKNIFLNKNINDNFIFIFNKNKKFLAIYENLYKNNEYYCKKLFF